MATLEEILKNSNIDPDEAQKGGGGRSFWNPAHDTTYSLVVTDKSESGFSKAGNKQIILAARVVEVLDGEPDPEAEGKPVRMWLAEEGKDWQVTRTVGQVMHILGTDNQADVSIVNGRVDVASLVGRVFTAKALYKNPEKANEELPNWTTYSNGYNPSSSVVDFEDDEEEIAF